MLTAVNENYNIYFRKIIIIYFPFNFVTPTCFREQLIHEDVYSSHFIIMKKYLKINVIHSVINNWR